MATEQSRPQPWAWLEGLGVLEDGVEAKLTNAGLAETSSFHIEASCLNDLLKDAGLDLKLRSIILANQGDAPVDEAKIFQVASVDATTVMYFLAARE